jgi:hypothetical protein
MTEAAVVEPGKIDLGRVIAETFRVIARNIVTFSVLGFLLCGLPLAVLGYFEVSLARAQLDGLSSRTFIFDPAQITGAAYGGLTALITLAILQGAVIYATVQDQDGQKPSIGDSLATGLRNFLPLIGLGILLAIALVFGFILLVVPGVMMLCAWCVAAPSLVAERTGVMGAFARSAELTRGNRWNIFGLLVIVWVISLVLDAIFRLAIGVPTFGGDPFEIAERVLTPAAVLLSVIRTTIAAVVTSTALSVLYIELRRARESLGPQWLRDIFA